MANIPSSPVWSPEVTQIETTDAVLGGPDGVINVQAKQLADRTAFLKQQVETAASVAGSAEDKAAQALAQIDAIEIATDSASDSAAAALLHKQAAEAAQALAELARNDAQDARADAAAAATGAAAERVLAGEKAAEARADASTALLAASQAVTERNQVVALGEQKKAEITALADASLVELDTVRDDAVAAKDLAVVKAQEATTQAGTAADQASVASGQASIATTQAGLASAAKTAAESARDAAQLSRGVFPTTAKALSKGVVSVGALVAGTGGTNGTFDLAFSGGGGSGAAGRFVVSGGKVTDITITAKGDSYTSAPTVSFAASTGLTGASATAVIGNLVAVGDYFSVPSADNAQSLILYQNSSGTAVEVKRYPSTEALTPLQALRQNYSGPAFVVTDQSNHRVLEVQRTGGLRTKLVNLTGSTTVAGSLDIQAGGSIASKPGSDVTFNSDGTLETGDSIVGKLIGNESYLFAVTDEQGNAILAVNALGQLVANFDLVPTSPVTPVAPVVPTGRVYDYSVNQIFGYGQSLSVGQATPAISTSQNYDNLMFYRGMRPQYDYTSETAAQWYASLVPAIEAQSPTMGSLAETPSMGTADMIKERILAEDGKSYTQHQYQILISTPGYGATTIGQLSKGGTHFARMVEQATYGKNLANAAGKTHAVQAVTWTQGESDYLSGTTQAAYVTALNTLISDINTDIKAATGQTKSIPVIGYQISSHIYYASDDFPDIALAQLEVEAANPLFYIACAMYPFAYHSGGHITNSSTRWLGGYYGLAYKRIVINGEDWKPLKPIASVRQSNFVEIRFNVPKGPLVFDTTQVAAQTNYGFALLDQNGAAMTISSVQIIDTDRIRITASAPIPAGAKVRYAFTGDSITGKGNLRDSQGDTITFAIPGSTAKRMDNWCLIFELGV